MYKIFLVDDNPSLLQELSDLIDWENLSLVVAGTFLNGSDALSAARADPPDIVLTDIKMPRLDGLGLAAKLKEELPSVRVMFMSSYDDFGYAQKAIDLGAHGYVLKPIDADALARTIEKTVAEIVIARFHMAQTEENKDLHSQMEAALAALRENLCHELMFYRMDEALIRERLAYVKLPAPPDVRSYVMLVTMIGNAAAGNAAGIYWLVGKICEIINSFTGNGHIVQVARLSMQEFAVLYLENQCDAPGSAAALTLATEINLELSRTLSIQTTIGVSDAVHGLADIPALFQQAREAAKAVFNPANNPVICYADIHTDEMNAPNLETVYSDVKELIAQGTEDAIASFVDQLLEGKQKDRRYAQNAAFSLVNAAAVLLLEAGYSFARLYGDNMTILDKLYQFDTMPDMKRWVVGVLQDVRNMARKQEPPKQGNFTDAVMGVIRRRYSEQITVRDIAAGVYLSAKYANSRFQKETGSTIFDCLQAYRIETAKKLLRENNKVAVVAESVGYISKPHFCLVFKAHTGYTPTEYRKKAAYL